MTTEHLDVIIIGAGLSGIGAAVHLQQQCPRQTFAVLEARGAIGGTWDLFRYPGIRSDSDMFTLGYRFKPWTNPKAIADGEDIRSYICEAAAENGIDRKIRYQHKVISADWSSRSAHWNLQVRRADTGEMLTFTSRFIFCCAGYYKYDSAFSPEFAGRESFPGTVVHPQFWPQDLNYAGKRIVVIGSGATAVTLVPALAERGGKVTMLQRSPGYVVSLPNRDPVSEGLRKVLPDSAVYSLGRVRNVLFQMTLFNLSRSRPEAMRKFLTGQVKKQVGPGVDMQHFTPKYNPWDERLCAVPDGDLFRTLRDGKADIVTDHIERFTPAGILLKSGRELAADIIVTATGLEIQIMGGMQLTLDGIPVNIPEKHYYKGAMLEDVPNMALVFGYTNSSWTLKADLIADYFCRVIAHMDRTGVRQCTPRNHTASDASEPFLNLSAGYIQRVLASLPRQGNRKPWRMNQNYVRDYLLLKHGRIDDGELVFSNPTPVSYLTCRAGLQKTPASEFALLH